MQSSTHHCAITIDGTTYQFMVSGFTEQDISAYAPRIGSGNIKYSDMTVYQAYVQEDFSHGMGFVENEDPLGYNMTSGSIDTRFPRRLALFTAAQDVRIPSGMTVERIIKIVEHKTRLFVISERNVYEIVPDDGLHDTQYVLALRSGDSAPFGSGRYKILDAISDGNNFYVFFDRLPVHRLVEQTNTWTPCNVSEGDSAGIGFYRAAFGGGFLWVADYNRPLVHYCTPEGEVGTPFMFEGGDPALGGDPDAVYVGAGKVPITGLYSWANTLYIGREDGLWYIPMELTGGQTTPVAMRAIDNADTKHSQNYAHMNSWFGRMYYTFRHELWRYTGGTIDNVTPRKVGYSYPYLYYSNFGPMVSVGPFLYVVATEDYLVAVNGYGAGEYGLDGYGGDPMRRVLLVYDGAAWHKLCDLTTPSETNCIDITAMTYVGERNQLFYAEYDSADEMGRIKYFQFTGFSNFPYDYYETSMWGANAASDGADYILDEDLQDLNLLIWLYDQSPIIVNRSTWQVGKFYYYTQVSGQYIIKTVDYNTGEPMLWSQGDPYAIVLDKNYLMMSRFDAGLATVPKHFSSLALYGQIAENQGNFVIVFYSLDDSGDWYCLGVYKDAKSTYAFPSDFCAGKSITIKILLVTLSPLFTPIVERVVLHYLPRPSTIYSFQFDAHIADNIIQKDRMIDERLAFDLYSALKQARAQVRPFKFTDMWGVEHDVYCTAVTWRPFRNEDGDENTPQELEGVMHVVLVTAVNEGV